MKKLLSALLAAIMMFSLNVAGFADNSKKQVLYKATEQLPSDIRSSLKNPSNYHKSMENKVISNQPVLEAHLGFFYDEIRNGLDTTLRLIESSESRLYELYLVFDAEPYWVNVLDSSTVMKAPAPTPTVTGLQSFINDISDMAEIESVNGKKCTIEEIHCFVGSVAYYEVALYLITDIGTYVKYYENGFTEPKIFTEAEFTKFSNEYYDWVTSYERNHDENGNQLYGGSSSLGEYLRINGIVTSIIMTNYEGKDFSFAIPAAIAAALIGITATVILIKKRKPAQKSS